MKTVTIIAGISGIAASASAAVALFRPEGKGATALAALAAGAAFCATILFERRLSAAPEAAGEEALAAAALAAPLAAEPKPEDAAFEGDVAPAAGATDSGVLALSLVELKFADSVLSKVTTVTEEAAFSLMERLVAIRDQAHRASQAAAATGGESATTDTVDKLANHAKDTIAKVRVALAEMRKHDKTAAAGLQSLGKELTSAIELLAEISDITERSRLIAFNMAIEAARIGSKGNGFKVIVNELRTLNDQTAEFSKRVSGLLGQFKKFNDSLVEKTVVDSARVSEEVELGIQDEEKAIQSLLSVSSACVDLSNDVEQVVVSTNKDLDGILESLQFQDITRQMVEGAQAILSEVQDDIGRTLRPYEGGRAVEPDGARVAALRSRLLSSSHTRGEKEAIQEVVV